MEEYKSLLTRTLSNFREVLENVFKITLVVFFPPTSDRQTQAESVVWSFEKPNQEHFKEQDKYLKKKKWRDKEDDDDGA